MEGPLLLFLSFAGLLLVGGLAASGAFNERRLDDLEACWKGYASRRKLTLERGSGKWPKWHSPIVTGRLRDIEIAIDIHTRSLKGTSTICTRVVGHALEPTEVRLAASSSTDRLAPHDEFVLLIETTTDDAPFDAAFQVRESRAGRAAEVLTREVRGELQAFLVQVLGEGTVLEYDDGEITLMWLGTETSPAVLDQACAVITAAARTLPSRAGYR